MPWQPIDISNEDANTFRKAFQKVSHLLVDEDLGPKLAPLLRNLGYDATDASALKLNGRSAEDVFSAAGKEQRLVVMQGRDFFDNRRLSLKRIAGVVVLPTSYGDALITALMYALSVLGKGRELCERTKIVVSGDGRFRVTNHNHTGARATIHYKLRIGGPPLIWTAAGCRFSTHDEEDRLEIYPPNMASE